MELYLVHDKPFSMDSQLTLAATGKWLLVSSKNNFTLEPLARYYCKPLLRASVSVPLLNGPGTQDKLNPFLKLQLVIPYPFRKEKSSLKLCSGDGFSFLEKIRQWCGQDNVRINLKLSQTNHYAIGGVDHFEAKDLPIKNLSEEGNPCGYGCEMSDLMLSLLRNNGGRLTLSIKLTENAIRSLLLQRFEKTNMGGGNKRLLEDAVCSDLSIIAANGTEIKCHKAMLAVHSDVFQTMFENNMKESITSVVELPDMSEQAVRAFLGFIYYWNMKEATESCDVALELLVAADMYHVSDLKSAIAELMGVMPKDWFNANMSVKLLIFTERQREVCQNNDWAELQAQAIRVLKSHMKDSFEALMNFKVFQQLLQTDPETAMRISDLILSFRVE